MDGYYVTWTKEIIASSPEEAARKARAMQRDPEASAKVFAVHSNARTVSVELSGETSQVVWDSAEQFGADEEYTAEFWALPPEQQLQWRVTHYLMEQLIIPDLPRPDGWWAECVNTGSDVVQDIPLITSFVIHTPPGSTGPSFRVTVEKNTPAPVDVTSG